jgi:hypothetical protein
MVLFSQVFNDADTGALPAFLAVLTQVATEPSNLLLSRSEPTTFRRLVNGVDAFLSPLADADEGSSEDDGGFFTSLREEEVAAESDRLQE